LTSAENRRAAAAEANRAVDFIKRQKDANKPMFVWVNFTHMHFRTHTKQESIGQSGRWQSPYHDTMITHDKNVGQVLRALDDLGIADKESPRREGWLLQQHPLITAPYVLSIRYLASLLDTAMKYLRFFLKNS